MFSKSLTLTLIDAMNKVHIEGCLVDMPPRWREVGKAGQKQIIETVTTIAGWSDTQRKDETINEFMARLLEAETIAYGVMHKGWALRPIRKTPKAQRPFCVELKSNGERCKAKAKRGYEVCNRHQLQRERMARMEFKQIVPNAAEVLRGEAIIEG